MKLSLAMCLPTPMPLAKEYPLIVKRWEPLTVWVTDRELVGEPRGEGMGWGEFLEVSGIFGCFLGKVKENFSQETGKDEFGKSIQ